MKDFIQLKVSLNSTNPLIWRQIQLHKDYTFFELHHIIQICMGWKNYHMFEFNLEGYRIGTIYEDDKFDGYGSDSLLDCMKTKLCDVISEVGDEIKYVYDFGDWWEHTLVIENFLDGDNQTVYPICIAGEMACPPEDCGSISGFYQNLEILKDKKHPEYKETKIWMPRGFDPNKFNVEKVNKQLDKLVLYIFKWLGC